MSKYIKQLQKRWGRNLPIQFYKMYSLHRVPFASLLSNIFEALDPYGARFAFPTVAAVARMKPDLVSYIEKEGHEVASHGYNHVRYPTLSAKERARDLEMSLRSLRKLGVKVQGFRAPYDNYTDDMPALIEKQGLLWDGGFGYRPEHREKTQFFHVDIEGKSSRTTFIPLNIWSDDRMIDGMNMGPDAVSKQLKLVVDETSRTGGVVMFDLHPIRIGQKRYVRCFEDVLEYSNGLGGWSPTPSEAVVYWNEHGRWKGDATFCLLLTGDIDNWVFSDYLRRTLWRRMI